MFKLFSKRDNLENELVLVRIAAQLVVPPILASRSSGGLKSTLDSPFVRGYLMGFFDAASQAGGGRAKNFNDFYRLLHAGVAGLFEDDKDAVLYAARSVQMLKDPSIESAMIKGGEEYMQMHRKETSLPFSLIVALAR